MPRILEALRRLNWPMAVFLLLCAVFTIWFWVGVARWLFGATMRLFGV